LRGKSYLTGEAFTAADAYLFVIASWAPYLKFDLSGCSELQAFMQRVGERPAVQAQQVADLERFLGIADQQLHVALQRALVHAEDAELADEGVDHHLEHMGQHMLLRVGDRAEGLGRWA
jgi:hypothetical protein